MDAESARLLETARRMLRDRAPQKALPILEQAFALEPTHAGIERLLNLTRVESRKSEAESLTSAALNHFLQNNYKKATRRGGEGAGPGAREQEGARAHQHPGVPGLAARHGPLRLAL